MKTTVGVTLLILAVAGLVLGLNQPKRRVIEDDWTRISAPRCTVIVNPGPYETVYRADRVTHEGFTYTLYLDTNEKAVVPVDASTVICR